MAVASGLAGPVLARPVYTIIFGTVACADNVTAPSNNSYSYHTMATATGSITDSMAQDSITGSTCTNWSKENMLHEILVPDII